MVIFLGRKLHHVNAFLLSAASLMLVVGSIGKSEVRRTSGRGEGSPEDVTLAVSDREGNHIGSAVSIQAEGEYHWAVTNRHVTGSLKTVCLTSGNGNSYHFNVVSGPTNKAEEIRTDLAFLWAPMATTKGLAVATWADQQDMSGETLPIIEATGFLLRPSEQKNRQNLIKSRGLRIDLLDEELEEGFDTTYTAEVQKGMSGGGVFANNKLIAINGAHSDPLWPVEWRSSSGKAINKDLNQKLSLVSIGISTRVIKREFGKIQMWAGEGKRIPTDERCRKVSTGAYMK